MSDQDVQAVEMLHRAICGEVALLDQALAPDWRGLPTSGHEVTVEEFKPHLDEFLTAFPDAKITIHEVFGTPGRIGVRAQMSGTHSGAWLGVQATNKPCVMAIHEFHHLEDGRITRTWPLDDLYGFLQQVQG